MELEPGEKIEDLQNGYLIIQNPKYFSFGTDAILLADFADVSAGERVIDFGTGCGIIPILLCAKTKGIHVTGIEIQQALARMAGRSVAMNGLEKSIRIVCGDLKDISGIVPCGADVVAVNPPYEKTGSGKENVSEHVNIAKREVMCTLEDVVFSASRILRPGGRLYMIYRTERFAELMACMRRHKVEPKRIRLVVPKQDRPPNFALVEGRKGAGGGVAFLPSLVVCEQDGTYTQEVKKIYHIGEENTCCI
ncbi:MAG: tRNA1(Val) (adenine(37)-N6)-methyltransferase [Eubacteriales bacterium]|nr:tRNA1(Val) (adenine(37)-N6)-methyltransferase [Eubacteriales bacterium]